MRSGRNWRRSPVVSNLPTGVCAWKEWREGGGSIPVPELSAYVEDFVSRGPIRKLSPAAQEVLAVITYRQPVSKNQINDIRGVDSSSPVRTLEKTGLIEVVGRLQVPGYPVLYGTTELLLEKLGLDSLEDLPPLSDLVPAPEVVDDLAAATFVA